MQWPWLKEEFTFESHLFMYKMYCQIPAFYLHWPATFLTPLSSLGFLKRFENLDIFRWTLKSLGPFCHLCKIVVNFWWLYMSSKSLSLGRKCFMILDPCFIVLKYHKVFARQGLKDVFLMSDGSGQNPGLSNCSWARMPPVSALALLMMKCVTK